jgi:CheY-like chemotaxis protein
MGGRIEVYSRAGHGSTFTVRLPRATDTPIEPLAAGTDTASAAKVGAADDTTATTRVLYIEDNLANVQVIERLLHGRADTALYVAQTGQLGIDLAREHQPSIILLDLHLPDVNGEVVLRRLQADPATARTPVIMLSADATATSVARLLAAGAAGYLTKPIDLRELLACIDTTVADEAAAGPPAGPKPQPKRFIWPVAPERPSAWPG